MSYSFKSQMGSGVPCTRNTRQGGSLPHQSWNHHGQRGHKGCALYPDFIRHQTFLLGARYAIFTRGYPPPPRKSLSKTKWLRHRSPMRGIGDSWLHTGHLAAHLGGWGSNSIHQTTSLWELGNSTCEVSPQKTTSRMHPGFHTCSIKHGPFMGFWVPIVKDRVEPQ